MIFSNHIPYTYLIGWPDLDLWYYGCRYAKDCHPNDFWVTYFTSSVEVESARKVYGEPAVRQVRKTFISADAIPKCQTWEDKVLTRVNAAKSKRWLNRTNRGRNFHSITTGLVTAKDLQTGETFQASVSDARFATGEIAGVNHGIEHKKELCHYCSNEFGINTISVHEKTCQKNPNRQPGPLAGRKLNSKQAACQYCGRTGAKHGITRHEKSCDLSPNREPHSSVGKPYAIKPAVCQYCGKEGGRSGITRHEKTCALNLAK